VPSEGWTTVNVREKLVERYEQLNEEMWGGHRSKSDAVNEAFEWWIEKKEAERDVEAVLQDVDEDE
jgi:hypothetical protein